MSNGADGLVVGITPGRIGRVCEDHVASPIASRTVELRSDIVVALAGVGPKFGVTLRAVVGSFDIFLVVAVGAGRISGMNVISDGDFDSFHFRNSEYTDTINVA